MTDMNPYETPENDSDPKNPETAGEQKKSFDWSKGVMIGFLILFMMPAVFYALIISLQIRCAIEQRSYNAPPQPVSLGSIVSDCAMFCPAIVVIAFFVYLMIKLARLESK